MAAAAFWGWSVNKFVFVLALLAGVVIVGSIATVPLSTAKARQMDAQNAAISRMAAAAALEAEQKAALRVEERTAVSPWLTALTVLVVVSGGGVAAALGAAGAARGGADVARSVRTARLPVAKQIAPGAFVYELRGEYWILDNYTGRRALLSDRAGRDAVRMQVMERLALVDRLATSAERIAIGTRSAAPGDWLAHIGAVEAQDYGMEVDDGEL